MRIFLDPGHGGRDSGATFRGLKESDIVLDICLAAIHQLQFLHHVAMSRFRDTYISLTQRALFANHFKADIFISIHANADPDEDAPGMPEAKGEEIWIYKGSKEAKKLAVAMKDHVNDFFPDHGFRGIKETTGLYVLRKTIMPAILIEIGFIDNLSEYENLKSPMIRNRIGHLIVNGIKRYAKYYD